MPGKHPMGCLLWISFFGGAIFRMRTDILIYTASIIHELTIAAVNCFIPEDTAYLFHLKRATAALVAQAIFMFKADNSRLSLAVWPY